MANKKPSGKVTLFDVAKRAGVSHTAVSMALRGSPEVGARQAEKIRALAAKLGYYPKAAAQMLRAGRTGYLGIVMAGSSQDVIAETGFGGLILAHFLGHCQARSIRNSIEFFQPAPDGGFSPPHSLSGGLVDGVVLAGFVDAGLRQWLSTQTRFPWVSIDEPGPYSVLCASDLGVAEAVRRLALAGHRRIGFWGGPTEFSTHRLEMEGFKRGVVEAGMDTGGGRWVKTFDPLDLTSGNHAINYSEWSRSLLNDSPRPTAVVCHGPSAAREFILTAARMGLDVPADLSVYCFCSAADAVLGTPPLSSIEADMSSIVGEAISMLSALTGSEKCAPKSVWFPPRVVDRESVAPLR